jgi:glyoxylase-like metal-dependent hydrolase (beta-lactamase superfamily II)
MVRRSCFPVLAILVMLGCGALLAQQQPLVGEETTKVSDHVWAIMGFPNIGIVVGTRATLVVDTGLGPRNGETVAKVAARLSKTSKLFLTTTHFHPEHAAGEPGFPPGTILIRNVVQQREMVQHGQEILEQFRSRPQNAALLSNVTLRTPDVLFDIEATVDLGAATARLLWVGEGHTKGDLVVFVEPTPRSFPVIWSRTRWCPTSPATAGRHRVGSLRSTSLRS